MQYPFSIPNDSPFPVANIPFGIFSTVEHPTPRPGVALGDYILDLQELIRIGLFLAHGGGLKGNLNAFAALPRATRSKLRKDIQCALTDGSSFIYVGPSSSAIIPTSRAIMHMPMAVPNFTDFMCSFEHVSTVGKLAGHEQVPPSFYNIPLGYNGRASSVVVSGKSITRPTGMVQTPDGAVYSACQKLDYEAEVGMFISQPVSYDSIVPEARMHEHVFGFVLLNDWSARDVQFYEMSPLGPFLGKAGATSISPWVVTLDALAEAGALHQLGSADPIEMTLSPFIRRTINLSVHVTSFVIRSGGHELEKLGESNVAHLHWSPFQMAAHLSSSGYGLATGDLIGTGTLSSTRGQALQCGNDPERRSGCLCEIVQGGRQPLQLSDGSSMTWLEDGDAVVLQGWAGSGEARIGFGQLHNIVAPSRRLPV
ncbi:hypothetical protein CC79DRAFT_1342123 [Sarocladium strictum]